MTSIFWVVFAAYVAFEAYRLGLGSLNQPGPGFIFFVSALVLFVLSVVDVIEKLCTKSRNEDAGPAPWDDVRFGKILLILAVQVGYAYFFRSVGFALSTFLLLVFLYKAIEPNPWWKAVTVSLVITVVSYLIFVLWLEVPFPYGLLAFIS